MTLSLLLAGLVVGVTDICPTNGNSQAEGDYFWALEKAGHSAVLISRGNNAEQVREIVSRLDAVLFTGGGDDIDGAPYDVPTDSGEGRPNADRNRLEDLLLAECLRVRKPIIGICRGMQFLNVRFGGSLYQDIPTSKAFKPKNGLKIEHRPGEWADNVTNPPAHTVEIVPGSRLAKVVGTAPLAVVSHHHQAPYRVAPGFKVTATAPDGVIECIESTDYPIVGFQFHPERAVGSVKHPGYDIPRTLRIFQNLMLLLKDGAADVRDYGARTDAVPGANAAAIQKAIDAVAQAGGGRVTVPAGKFVTGTLWLKSNVELHLDDGAELIASPSLADYNADDAYPENWGCRSEGWQAKHLVIARDAENVAITGPGRIDGNGGAFFARSTRLRRSNTAWRHGYSNSEDRRNAVRPGQEIVFVGCRNVRVEDVILCNMPCWTCYFHGCEKVRVSGCLVRTVMNYANTDGFDVDCCRDVVVANCDIETGDDCLTVRASALNKLGRFARPCEDIVFSNCICRCSASGVRIGVGTGTIRNVLLRDLDIREAGRGIVIQSTYPESKHPSGEGVTISNVVCENLRLRESGQAIVVTAGTANTVATISDLTFRNLDLESSGIVVVEGCGVTPIKNVLFDGLRFEVYARPFPYQKDWEVVTTNCDHEAAVWLDRVKNVRFKDAKITFRHDHGDTRTRAFSVVDSEAYGCDNR